MKNSFNWVRDWQGKVIGVETKELMSLATAEKEYADHPLFQKIKKEVMEKPTIYKKFQFYFWFNGWGNLNLGFHISLRLPNIEIHVPFGFFRIGWCEGFHLGDESFLTLLTQSYKLNWNK